MSGEVLKKALGHGVLRCFAGFCGKPAGGGRCLLVLFGVLFDLPNSLSKLLKAILVVGVLLL